MGHEILYCAGCQTQLRSTDFEKGKAFRIDSTAYCKACVPPDRAIPDPESPPTKASSKGRGSTTRIHRVPLAPGAAKPSPGISRTVIGVIVAGVVVGLLAITFMAGGGTSAPPSSHGSEPKSSEKPLAQPPAPNNPIVHSSEEPPASRPPAPVPESLRAARTSLQAHPEEINAAIVLYEKALQDTRDSVYFQPTRQELGDLYDRDFATVDREAGQAVLHEEFAKALATLDAAKRRRGDPAWQRRVESSIAAMKTQVQEVLAQLRSAALEAWEASRDDDVRKARDRVVKWGLEEPLKEFDQAIAKAPPRAPPPSAEAVGYRKSWEEAIALAGARDYDAALKVLAQAASPLREAPVRAEASADLDLLRSARGAMVDLLQKVARWPKDRKLKVSVLQESGIHDVEGMVFRASPLRAELADGEMIEWGEATAASLASALAAGSDPKLAADPRPLILLPLLEGDPEGAKTFGPVGDRSVPEKYWKQAGKVLGAGPHDSDAAKLFHAALEEVRQPGVAGEALAKFQRLLKEYPETAVVRRNRASLLDWSQRAGREYLFLTEALAGHGVFRLAKGPKGEPCWLSQSDKKPESAKDNYVEFTFFAIADADYHCWAYVGGCCAETLTFSCQGTELRTTNPKTRQSDIAEPGSELSVPVRQTLLTSIRTHAGHGGPRQPVRWGWVAIPMPRYSQPGVKTIRLLTGELGFAVGYAFVTSLSNSPPQENELREAEKARPPRVPSAGQGQTGAPKPLGKLVFSENFNAGPGRFGGGEIVDGGSNGSRALAIPPGGVSSWGFITLTGKETTRIRFKVKALVDVAKLQVFVWSDRLQNNARYYIEDLRKDEWRDVEFGAADLRTGFARDGQSFLGEVISNIRIFFAGDSNARVLIDDLEVRD